MATQYRHTTAPIMTAQRLVENCVLTNQTAVVDEMLNRHLLAEEYIYPFLGDVMEWWLIDSWLAERLKQEGEVIIDEYGKRIVACPTEDEAEEYIREQEE